MISTMIAKARLFGEAGLGAAVTTGTAAAVLLLALAGCSGGGGTVSSTASTGSARSSATPPSPTDTGVPSAGGQTNSTPSATASPAVDAAIASLKATLESTLKASVNGTAIPEQERLRAALTAAGIPAQNLEVSVSRTPTGLDVDAIEAAAKSGNDCVIGQIREGKVSMTVLPVLAGGKCFVGDSR